MSRYSYFPPYVPVAQRRAEALKEVKRMEKSGKKLSPVRIEGTKIAKSFWGKAWCDNVESYQDYSNRLPRGRTYVRNGSVLDLQIERGKITALVNGSRIYKIEIKISELPKKHWEAFKKECAGQIGSLIELIRGKLSDNVLALITRRDGGLFPKPSEIKMNCSCPDWAGLCKHLAAVLYGVGARLDTNPDLFFLLRGVDHHELVVADVAAIAEGSNAVETLDDASISSVFGIELDGIDEKAPAAQKPEKAKPAVKAKKVAKPAKSKARPAGKTKKPSEAKTAARPKKASKAKAKTAKAGKGLKRTSTSR